MSRLGSQFAARRGAAVRQAQGWVPMQPALTSVTRAARVAALADALLEKAGAGATVEGVVLSEDEAAQQSGWGPTQVVLSHQVPAVAPFWVSDRGWRLLAADLSYALTLPEELMQPWIGKLQPAQRHRDGLWFATRASSQDQQRGRDGDPVTTAAFDPPLPAEGSGAPEPAVGESLDGALAVTAQTYCAYPLATAPLAGASAGGGTSPATSESTQRPTGSRVAGGVMPERPAQDLPSASATCVAAAPAAPIEPSATSRPAQDLMLTVLGQVELLGVERQPTRPNLHLLIYLAFHRRGVDPDRLATALWPERAVTSGAVRNRVTEARAVVDGHISEGPNRRLLPAVKLDWEQFALLAGGDLTSRLQALALVRGRPFDGLPDAEWLDLEGLRTEVEARIIDCAVTTARDLLAQDDPAGAFKAARAGLHANPYEERLFRLAMDAARRQGSTGLLRTLARELQVVLGEDDDTV